MTGFLVGTIWYNCSKEVMIWLEFCRQNKLRIRVFQPYASFYEGFIVPSKYSMSEGAAKTLKEEAFTPMVVWRSNCKRGRALEIETASQISLTNPQDALAKVKVLHGASGVRLFRKTFKDLANPIIIQDGKVSKKLPALFKPKI